MAPVYADHPFPLIPTPIFMAKGGDAPPDMFDELASEMANVHNLVLRGLNSIYLQAPHIKPADEKPFCAYITHWYNLLHGHHHGEETRIFPTVEKLTGVEGIMDANVEQHKAFHDGMDRLKAYADGVLAGTDAYDGSRVVALIDEFGATLAQHLTDEIPSLLGLRRYGDALACLPDVFAREAEMAMKKLGPEGTVCCVANLDVHYEGDRWLNWPPIPFTARLLLRSVFWWMHADIRKFGAVDRLGNLKPLYAVPESP